MGDRPEQFTGRAQHRVFRDRLRGAREVLQGKDRLLDLAEDAVRLQLNQLGPPGRHLRRIGLHCVKCLQRIVDRPLQLGLERLLVGDRSGQGGASDDEAG